MPLLDVFGSIFMVFLMVAWIWVIIGVISDVFRSRDLGGLAKGLWMLFIISIPWLGVLSYLIIRGKGMEERSAAAMVDAGLTFRTSRRGFLGNFRWFDPLFRSQSM